MFEAMGVRKFYFDLNLSRLPNFLEIGMKRGTKNLNERKTTSMSSMSLSITQKHKGEVVFHFFPRHFILYFQHLNMDGLI